MCFENGPVDPKSEYQITGKELFLRTYHISSTDLAAGQIQKGIRKIGLVSIALRLSDKTGTSEAL
jgi:hypothetical protein